VTGADGTVLPGATVSISGVNLKTVTDTGGHYRFTELPVGNYVVKASYIGYETETKAFILKDDASVSFILEKSSILTEEVTSALHQDLVKLPGNWMDPRFIAIRLL